MAFENMIILDQHVNTAIFLFQQKQLESSDTPGSMLDIMQRKFFCSLFIVLPGLCAV